MTIPFCLSLAHRDTHVHHTSLNLSDRFFFSLLHTHTHTHFFLPSLPNTHTTTRSLSPHTHTPHLSLTRTLKTNKQIVTAQVFAHNHFPFLFHTQVCTGHMQTLSHYFTPHPVYRPVLSLAQTHCSWSIHTLYRHTQRWIFTAIVWAFPLT